MPEDFLSKWQKAKRDIHKDRHTHRLPLVVLSAAVAAKKLIGEEEKTDKASRKKG